jgi:hypothetical protein
MVSSTDVSVNGIELQDHELAEIAQARGCPQSVDEWRKLQAPR